MTKKKLVFQILFLLLLIVGTVLIVKQNASLPYKSAAKVQFFLQTCKLGGYAPWGVAIVKTFIGF